MMKLPDEVNSVTNSFESNKGQRFTSSGDKCDSRCPFLVHDTNSQEYQDFVDKYAGFIAKAVLNEFEHDKQIGKKE